MSKKLITACLALVAFAAFALPVTASAANKPHLTHGATAIAPGTKILATNVGNVLFENSEGGILSECSVGRFTGTVHTNTGTEVKGEITTSTFSGTGALRGEHKECTGTFGDLSVDTNIGNGTPWCMESGPEDAEHTLRIRGGGCTSAQRSITFVQTVTNFFGNFNCRYNRTAAIPGKYTTGTDATVSMTHVEFKLEAESGFACPSTGFVTMTMTLETDSATAEPISITEGV
jgi:hypothetical protein